MTFSSFERLTLTALGEAALPPGRLFPGAGAGTLPKLERALATWPPAVTTGYRGLLWVLEAAARATTGRAFAALPLGRRLEVLRSLERVEATRLAVRGLLSPLKMAHFDDPGIHAALGCRYHLERPQKLETPRWRDQVVAGQGLSDGESLECEVVVVGTGAGGAPLAAKLAARGHAVLLIEEGEYLTRKDFNGRPFEMMQKMYRDSGATIAVGNTFIPVPTGKGVGGTTLINSGTCFRVPESTLVEWRTTSGLPELTMAHLDPFYREVERFLEVGPSQKDVIGPIGDLIARGCDALGYSHHPLARNAPGCDGQGLCCFGCPTDAKRSTNVSYVPAALEKGAQLITGLRVERLLLEGDRAVGVEGVAAAAGGPRRISVRAKVVVLAMGALGTPAFLLRQGLCNRSGQVGRNLSIHPATAALAVFDQPVRPFDTVPQGYAIDEFHDEGILFEGSSLPLQITATMTPGYGPAYTALMEAAPRTTLFGFMVKDSSRGRVSVGPRGDLRLRYWLNGKDLGKLRRGLGILARVFFAAGARTVLPPVAGWEALHSLDDVARFEAARYPARHVDLTAYHPLGTCQMGADAGRSVVGTSSESHDLRGLFVCDGSALPGSPGVNPQLTIMAMSLRAADFVERAAQ